MSHLRAACILVSALAVPASHAQPTAQSAAGYPNKPIRIVVTTGPGGGPDQFIRRIGPQLTRELGPHVVDNRPGATGGIGIEVAANALPDGYTIVITSGQVVTGMLMKTVKTDIAKALTPIAQLSRQSYLMVANPSFPASSVKELIALARTQPGKIVYGSSGIGGVVHLGMELLSSLAGIEMLHAPYKAGGQAMTGLIGGEVQLSITNILTASPQVQSGKIKALAVTGLERIQIFPAVPTISESGIAGFDLTNWYGMSAPMGTPAPIIEKINRIATGITNSPEIKEALLKEGINPVGPHPPAEFGRTVAREIAMWDKFFKSRKINLSQ